MVMLSGIVIGVVKWLAPLDKIAPKQSAITTRLLATVVDNHPLNTIWIQTTILLGGALHLVQEIAVIFVKRHLMMVNSQ